MGLPFLKIEKITEIIASKKPATFVIVICSLKYSKENKMGVIIDIFAATDVMVMPASCVDFPMMKNIAIKSIPMNIANQIHPFWMISDENVACMVTNPNTVAAR